MPKFIRPLSKSEIEKFYKESPKEHNKTVVKAVGDPPGLFLVVKDKKYTDASGKESCYYKKAFWMYRRIISSNPSREEKKTLGQFRLGLHKDKKEPGFVGVEEARQKARELDFHWRQFRTLNLLREGPDPTKPLTLSDSAELYHQQDIKDIEIKFKNDHDEQSRDKRLVARNREYQRFKKHVLSVIGNKLVTRLVVGDIISALQVGHKGEATVDKCIAFLSNVLRHVIVAYKYPQGLLQLSDARTIKQPLQLDPLTNHMAYLAPEELGKFMGELRGFVSVEARLVELVILLALRPSNVRTLTWNEVDLKAKEIHIPFTKMKVRENGDFRIPLCKRAYEILKGMQSYRASDLPIHKQFVFPSPRNIYKPFADSVTTKMIERMNKAAKAKGNSPWIDKIQTRKIKSLAESRGEEASPVVVTVHGIARGTFDTWASSSSYGHKKYPVEIIEYCLHHRIKNSIRQSYMHDDFFKERQEILRAWEKFCLKE